MTPAELMLGQKLQSRLDLLWQTKSFSARAAANQSSKKNYHSTVSIPQEAAVSIRNYSDRAPKRTPASVWIQSGPLFHRCSLPDGRVVKHHQDK